MQADLLALTYLIFNASLRGSLIHNAYYPRPLKAVFEFTSFLNKSYKKLVISNPLIALRSMSHLNIGLAIIIAFLLS